MIRQKNSRRYYKNYYNASVILLPQGLKFSVTQLIFISCSCEICQVFTFWEKTVPIFGKKHPRPPFQLINIGE